MNEMNEEKLREAHQIYEKEEKRAKYYDIAVEIVNKGYPLQASIIILTVWNKARFKFLRNEDFGNVLTKLDEIIKKGNHEFGSLKEKDFKTFDFKEIETPMKKVYSDLSEIKGVEYTGASKVMHLLNRYLFLMWDRAMREEYGKEFCGRVYKKNAESYLDYHIKMQEKVKNIKWNQSDRTLPKAIDEFNFVNMTLPRLGNRN